MKKHLKLAFIFVFMGLIPLSCFEDDCGDLPEVRNFEILDISSENVHSNTKLEILDSIAYPWDSIGVKYEITEKEYVSIMLLKKRNSFLSTPVYACSPAQPHSIDDLIDVEIISNVEFMNPSHPFDTVQVGDDITSYFVIGAGYSLSTARYFLLDETLYNTNLSEYENLFLKLLKEPFQNLNLNFTTTLTFSNEKEFIFENQDLRLLRK